MLKLNEDYKLNFGNKLKKLMDFSEKSQRDIAEELGCSQKSISNWINGKSEPSLGHILKLKKYFECDYEDLLDK